MSVCTLKASPKPDDVLATLLAAKTRRLSVFAVLESDRLKLSIRFGPSEFHLLIHACKNEIKSPCSRSCRSNRRFYEESNEHVTLNLAAGRSREFINCLFGCQLLGTRIVYISEILRL